MIPSCVPLRCVLVTCLDYHNLNNFDRLVDLFFLKIISKIHTASKSLAVTLMANKQTNQRNQFSFEFILISWTWGFETRLHFRL